MNTLNGKLVALLVAEGFEQVELTSPKEALEKAGAFTTLVSLLPGEVQAWNRFTKGDRFPVDLLVARARSEDFDALVLPGGVASADQLRADPDAVKFVRDFFDQHKPVASICHGASTLIDAGVVSGRTLTSYPSIRMDLVNAGADWKDEPVVVDNGLVTSRNPKDLYAFNRAIVEVFASDLTVAA